MGKIGIAAGLVVGNYLCAAFGVIDWNVAHDRSFFQVVAIVAVSILS